jgi:hypothetical protein
VDALPQGIVESVQRGWTFLGSQSAFDDDASTIGNGHQYDVTISAVDPSKACLSFSVQPGSEMSSFTNEYIAVRGRIVNATTIRFNVKNRGNTPNSNNAVNVNWEVVEFA